MASLKVEEFYRMSWWSGFAAGLGVGVVAGVGFAGLLAAALAAFWFWRFA